MLVASLLRAAALRHELGRHLRGVHRGLSRLCRQQVLDPSHDDTPESTALVTELRALFETDALGLALGEKLFVERVRNLDALFFKRKRAQITTPRGFTPLLLVVGLARVVRLLVFAGFERAGESIERAQLVFELELELRRVDALGLRDEQPTLEKLELDTKSRVRCPKIVSLFRDDRERAVRVAKRAFELSDARVDRERFLRVHRRVYLFIRERVVDLLSVSFRSQCTTGSRRARAAALSVPRSMPSSRSSSARSSISRCVAFAATSGIRNVPLSRRL